MTDVPIPMNSSRAAATGAKDYVLEDQIGHLLRRAHQRATSIFVANFTAHQLTPTQFATLAKIADEGQVSQNRLGRLTAMDPATMKGVIGRLQNRGLIRRGHDPGDRRRTLWRLTEAGEALFAAAIPDGKRTTSETLAPLSKTEQTLLLNLLRRLA